jgi:hypothetical protein
MYTLVGLAHPQVLPYNIDLQTHTGVIMNKWQLTNTRGFCVYFTNGGSTTVSGPGLTPDTIELGPAYTLQTITRVEEYTYEDTIKWSIEANHKQIATCLKQIKALEAELEAA